MPKEKLFTTHAARAGDPFEEAPNGFQCTSCGALLPSIEEVRVHVYERHGPGPGPLPTDDYIRNQTLDPSSLRFKCRLCWHPTPSLKLMLFHLRRHHAIKPLPWEVTSTLSCRYYDVFGGPEPVGSSAEAAKTSSSNTPIRSSDQ